MKMSKLAITIGLVFTSSAGLVQADGFAEAITGGDTTLDANLRYESVSQDNGLKDANALTLRTRLNYTTADYNGAVGVIEFEDSRVVAGVDDYNNTLGKNTDHSVIADPETTELDQAYLQYKYAGLTAKGGRQVMTLDNQRFVGDVGWRQDRQTFDALHLSYLINDALQIDYAYIDQRNRIFAEAKDINAKDNLLNASYKTSVGKLTGYAYLLEEDEGVSNGLDTYGLRFSGSTKLSDTQILYTAEYATQDADVGNSTYSTDYMTLEAGAVFAGITAKLGYELLGSDSGDYGFATPLATLHKFNGWSDQFLNTPTQGLADLYLSVSSKVAGGSFTLAYHEFSADESNATIDDLGSEINAVYAMPIAKHYKVGVKYAGYFAGDSAAGKVDTDKVWVWASAKF
ncbi:MAG: hypothetical protein ACI935_002306 [Moritella dasanensis]|jgi:hypothetical protein